MIMMKDDHYVLVIVTNQCDLVVGYDFGITENSYTGLAQKKIKRPLECNCEFNDTKISTVYFKADEFDKFNAIIETLSNSPYAQYLNTSVEVVK